MPGIYKALCDYAASDFYPCHMPGHKRNPAAGEMGSLSICDITEIDGFDNLHQPEGILLEAQQRANALYQADETFYLINGSTSGVLAAVMSVTMPGDELLIMRGCHKSVYHGAILQQLQLRYLPTHMIREYDICDGADVHDMEEMLECYPAVKAVVVTSPTYEGVVSDLQAITELVHRKGKVLIVDEAHGAHLMPEKRLTGSGSVQDAITAGADLVIHSLHKTLPAMTQTALLHVKGERVNRHRLRKCLSMIQSSSPSYLLMASMDSCISYMMEHGAGRFAFFKRQTALLRERTEGCRHIRIGAYRDVCEKGYRLTGWDEGKLVISVKGTDITGQQLYDMLREKYHLQMEMAAGSYVLAMMTIMDTEQGFQRLADSLCEIDAALKEKSWQESHLYDAELPAVGMTLTQAFYAEQEEIALETAEGRVAADFVNLYPPGIPLVVPGEILERDFINRIKECQRQELTVQGILSGEKIRVVR